MAWGRVGMIRQNEGGDSVELGDTDSDLDLILLRVGICMDARAQPHLPRFAGDLSLLMRVSFKLCMLISGATARFDNSRKYDLEA